MQVPAKYYNPKYHDRYKAVSVEWQDASRLTANGGGRITMEAPTRYRGLIVICSKTSLGPVTYALARLQKCEGYDWVFDFVQHVVEMPINGGRGLFTLVVPKGDITPYPKHVILERKDYAK